MSIDRFRDRIINEFVPLFCNHLDRRYGPEGFTENFDGIGETDAANFLRAMDAKLVNLDKKGKLYKAKRTKDGEQLFWEYDKNITPRTYSLSIEVIITIATLAVLHFDYGWPRNYLGTQSLAPEAGAIDLVAYADENRPDGLIFCEIKKNINDTNKLISAAQLLGSNLPVAIPPKSAGTIHRKVAALRHWRPPIFWALGPEGYGAVFKMGYFEDGRMAFEPATTAELRFSERPA